VWGWTVSAPQVPRPRRRLTQAEWDAELDRARTVQADDFDRYIARKPKPLRTPTVRRRSWWQRGWKR
jgi:hypothetical protein